MKNSLFLFSLIVPIVFFSACSGGQRVEPENNNNSNPGSTGIFENSPNSNSDLPSTSQSNGTHEVEVIEVLNTSKYSYLRVSEDDKEPYWIASVRLDFQEGQKLLYEGGLLKTNFKSIEHDRIFDRVYLVSKIGLSNGEDITKAEQPDESPKTVSNTFEKPDQSDIVDLSTIVNDPEQFEGKKVKVYGEVVKLNPNIMDRNWLHIKDGTADEFDFVLTTQSVIPLGHAMVFEGTISRNRDFGAGYTYDLIMENAQAAR